MSTHDVIRAHDPRNDLYIKRMTAFNGVTLFVTVANLDNSYLRAVTFSLN